MADLDPPLTQTERDTLLWLPSSWRTHVFGTYPHDDTVPVAADTRERADALFAMENRRHALVHMVAVDRPGTGEPWRDRRWVLSPRGFAARIEMVAGHA